MKNAVSVGMTVKGAAGDTVHAVQSVNEAERLVSDTKAATEDPGINACANSCTKRQLQRNQVVALTVMAETFKTVEKRCVTEKNSGFKKTVQIGAQLIGAKKKGDEREEDKKDKLEKDEEEAVTRAAAEMQRQMRSYLDNQVCPGLTNSTEASLVRLEEKTATSAPTTGYTAGGRDLAAAVKRTKKVARLRLRDLATLCPSFYTALLKKPRSKLASKPWSHLCHNNQIGPSDFKNLMRPQGLLDDIKSMAEKVTSRPEVAFIFDVSSMVGLATASGGLSLVGNAAFLVSRFFDGQTKGEDCKKAAAILMAKDNTVTAKKDGAGAKQEKCTEEAPCPVARCPIDAKAYTKRDVHACGRYYTYSKDGTFRRCRLTTPPAAEEQCRAVGKLGIGKGNILPYGESEYKLVKEKVDRFNRRWARPNPSPESGHLMWKLPAIPPPACASGELTAKRAKDACNFPHEVSLVPFRK